MKKSVLFILALIAIFLFVLDKIAELFTKFSEVLFNETDSFYDSDNFGT